MNSPRPARRRFAWSSVLICVATCAGFASAQEFETSALPTAATVLAEPVELSIGPGLGQVTFTRKLFYRYLYADGLQTEPGVERSSSVHRVTASLGVDVGPAFSAAYALGWMTFSDKQFDDSVSHNASITGKRVFGDWRTSLSYIYSRASAPLLETARQTQNDSHGASLRADRSLGSRTTLQLGLVQNIRSSDAASDFISWTTDDWLHYRISSAVITSAGYSYGYTKIDGSSDMDFHQLRGRVRWQLTEKVQMDVRAGVEKRRIVDSSQPDSNTPIYGAAFLYHPGETTTLSLVGDRSVWPSYFKNQVTRNTQWRASINQRLLGKAWLDMGIGRSTSMFRGTSLSVVTDREDVRNFYDAALSTSFAWGGAVSVTYQYQENDSSLTDFSVTRRMIGIQVSYGF